MATEEPVDEGEWADQDAAAGPSPATGRTPERRRSTGPHPEFAGGARPKPLPAPDHHAAHLRETAVSAYLFCSMSQVFREVGPESYKLYLLKVLEDAGNPSDPIERMLIEQICLAHHNVGRLHVKAASAENLEEARVYLGSAALLTGEFRRTISTLKCYREPARAPAGRAEVAGPVAGLDKGLVDGELGSNTEGLDHDEGTIPLTESAAGRGRQAESGQAARAKRRRA